MESTDRDPLVARVLAWHNRHPLARRIRPEQVHSIGRVVLPFEVPGSQDLPAPAVAPDDPAPAPPATASAGPPIEPAAPADAPPAVFVPEVVFSEGDSESPALEEPPPDARPPADLAAGAGLAAADERGAQAAAAALSVAAGVERPDRCAGAPAAVVGPGHDAPGDNACWPTRRPPAAAAGPASHPRWHPARWWPLARPWRALFSEDCIERLSPRRVAAIARRHGSFDPPGPAAAPERWLQLDARRQSAGQAGQGAVPVYLLTAAIEGGGARHRLLLSPLGGGPVFGHRLWDRRRVATAGSGLALAMAVALGALWHALPGAGPEAMAPAVALPAVRASSASVASAASAASSAASAVQVAIVATAPASVAPSEAAGPAASSPSTPVANVAAAASAPLVDGDEPPPSADLPPQGTAVAARDRPVDVDPRWGRFELPILKRHVDDDSRREARARAAARQAEAAAGPRPPAAIVADAWRAEPGTAAAPAAAGREPRPAAPAAPGARPRSVEITEPARGSRAWAVVLPPIDDRRHAQLAMLKLREVGALVRGEQHAELMPSGKGWRAILFPFADANAAEHARIALAGQGLPAEVVEF